jgi:antitoxin (DNA-binding transcriptional repressor) of toxin-antitoxin stability system
MASIDAEQLPTAAVKALEAGKRVSLTRAGKVVAVLRASPARRRISSEQAQRILAQLRKADRHDDWTDFIDWNTAR